MKSSIVNLTVIAVIILLATGCSVNTKLIERERVDQEVEGNQGYLTGTPPPVSADRRMTRKYYEVQVELPAAIEEEKFSTKPSHDSSVSDYSVSAPEPEETAEETTSIVTSEKAQLKQEYLSYKVKKGDTLQKISEKFFGTTKRWKDIFSENKDTLKSPDKVRPGQTIRIPKSGNIEVKESEYIK